MGRAREACVCLTTTREKNEEQRGVKCEQGTEEEESREREAHAPKKHVPLPPEKTADGLLPMDDEIHE
jgi:hypothetical protein